MIIPANAAAEQIQRLTEINGDIDQQIEQLQASQVKNVEIIDAFSPMAEWVEIPDPEPQTVQEAPPVLDIPPLEVPVEPAVTEPPTA